MKPADDPQDQILACQERFERGPQREGAFAVWLLMRVALDIGHAPGPADRTEKRRVTLLAKRIASLSLAMPLAKGLTASLDHLQEGTLASSRIALSQLVAPVREALGVEASEIVALAAKQLHEAQRGR
jgi:hypothetical protein